jgi:hypothetical protein
MPKYSVQQLVPNKAEALRRDTHDIVAIFRNAIVDASPQLADDPTLNDRLATAYCYAKRIGVTRDDLIQTFLYIEAGSPGFYRQAEIARWLEKGGASADDRLQDLIDGTRRKLREAKEGR